MKIFHATLAVTLATLLMTAYGSCDEPPIPKDVQAKMERLVGDWEWDDGMVTWQWSPGRQCLIGHFQDAEGTPRGVSVIGWDAEKKQLVDSGFHLGGTHTIRYSSLKDHRWEGTHEFVTPEGKTGTGKVTVAIAEFTFVAEFTERVIGGEPAEDIRGVVHRVGPHYKHLKPIEWTIGQWKMAGQWEDGVEFIGEERSEWILNKNFMRSIGWYRGYDGKRVDYQIVTGWDPQNEKFVSRFSTSIGGTAKRVETYDPERKRVKGTEHGVDADGQTYSFDVEMQFVSDDEFTWKGTNFQGPVELPVLEFTFTRIKPAEAAGAIPPKALQALQYLVGKWETETYVNGEKVGAGVDRRRWLPGGHAISIVTVGREADAPLRGSAIAGWDAKENQVVEYWYLDSGLSGAIRYPLSGIQEKTWTGNLTVTPPNGQQIDGTCVLEKTDTGFEWTATWQQDGKQMERKGITRRLE